MLKKKIQTYYCYERQILENGFYLFYAFFYRASAFLIVLWVLLFDLISRLICGVCKNLYIIYRVVQKNSSVLPSILTISKSEFLANSRVFRSNLNLLYYVVCMQIYRSYTELLQIIWLLLEIVVIAKTGFLNVLDVFFKHVYQYIILNFIREPIVTLYTHTILDHEFYNIAFNFFRQNFWFFY